jgi:hypothetical protein
MRRYEDIGWEKEKELKTKKTVKNRRDREAIRCMYGR